MAKLSCIPLAVTRLSLTHGGRAILKPIFNNNKNLLKLIANFIANSNQNFLQFKLSFAYKSFLTLLDFLTPQCSVKGGHHWGGERELCHFCVL